MNRERISALYDALKRAGRKGIYLDDLRRKANEELADKTAMNTHSHLAYLLRGWAKGDIHVGGYLTRVIEALPDRPKNVNYVRLKKGARKRELMRSLRRAR